MHANKLKTSVVRSEDVIPSWYSVDASGKVLGRLATKIAVILMGKHKPTYTPNVDTGDFVVVTNAHLFRLTGRKTETMIYPRYSHYPGGYREVSYKQMFKEHPERIVHSAVRRMLPKSALGRHMLNKLKVYAKADHPHSAQSPQPLDV
ncbi:MAG: 50S ribosomal protein L13 [Planctomycetota bacterium]